jgi:hypothetical protein
VDEGSYVASLPVNGREVSESPARDYVSTGRGGSGNIRSPSRPADDSRSLSASRGRSEAEDNIIRDSNAAAQTHMVGFFLYSPNPLWVLTFDRSNCSTLLDVVAQATSAILFRTLYRRTQSPCGPRETHDHHRLECWDGEVQATAFEPVPSTDWRSSTTLLPGPLAHFLDHPCTSIHEGYCRSGMEHHHRSRSPTWTHFKSFLASCPCVSCILFHFYLSHQSLFALCTNLCPLVNFLNGAGSNSRACYLILGNSLSMGLQVAFVDSFLH